MPTITIELSDESYKHLQLLATERNVSVEAIVASNLLDKAQASARDFEETCAAIAEGIADGEAGRERPWEEFVAEWETRQETRAVMAGKA